VTEPPWQKVVGPLAATVTEGNEFTTTAIEDEVVEHPAAFETITL
jgi:hypothetical protein